MTVRRANGADFWVVIDRAGRLVAQGRRETCELVAAGRPIFVTQGSLFDE